jgi:hypothetical protein
MGFPKYDEARYQSLIQSALFRVDPWMGTIQDLGTNKYPTSASAAARIVRYGSTQSWINGGDSTSITTAAVPAIVNCTQPFSVEWKWSMDRYAVLPWVMQQRNNVAGNWGGLILYHYAVAGLGMYVYTGVGAATRSWQMTVPVNRCYHGVVSVDTSVAAGNGYCWVNAAPVATAAAGVGPGVSCPVDTVVTTFGANAGDQVRGLLLRVYQRALDNEDVACLCAAASSLVSG